MRDIHAETDRCPFLTWYIVGSLKVIRGKRCRGRGEKREKEWLYQSDLTSPRGDLNSEILTFFVSCNSAESCARWRNRQKERKPSRKIRTSGYFINSLIRRLRLSVSNGEMSKRRTIERRIIIFRWRRWLLRNGNNFFSDKISNGWINCLTAFPAKLYIICSTHKFYICMTYLKI